jgi:hypothetical protein
MTFITGYQNRRGPYITNTTSGNSVNDQNKNDPQDMLIWNVTTRNEGGTNGKQFDIWDNAASTDHTSTPDDDFRVFTVSLAAGDEDEDMQGAMDWNMETPILARNGFYAKGDDDVIYTVMYTPLPQSNPYDSTSSPSASDLARRASLVPDLVCCRAGYLKETDSTMKVISTRDCEIWGVYTWNSDTSNYNMLRVNDGDGGLLSIRLGFAGKNNSHSLQSFPIPIYAKGGIKLRALQEGGGSGGSGVAATILFREFEHSGRDLDSSGRL